MKILFTLLSFGLAAASAQAASQPVSVSFTKDATAASVQDGTISITLGGDGAQLLYDTLDVPAAPTQDVIEFHKLVSGITCYDLTGDPRLSGCSIRISTDKGVIGALPGLATPANAMTVNLDGGTAQTIYEALNVAEKAEDAESYNFSKTMPGISAQRHRLTNTYDVVMVADPAKGILR